MKLRIPGAHVIEYRRLANLLIDHLGSQGFHVECWRSKTDDHWCELIAIDLQTGERWRVESDDLYLGVCRMAEQVGINMSDG